MEMTLKALGICQKVSLCYHQRQKLWINPSNVRKIQLSRFEPYPKIFWSIHYIFSKFLRAGKLCREKVVQAWSQRPNICDLLQVSFPAQLNLHLEKRFSQQIKTIIATKCCLFVCFKGGSVIKSIFAEFPVGSALPPHPKVLVKPNPMKKEA